MLLRSFRKKNPLLLHTLSAVFFSTASSSSPSTAPSIFPALLRQCKTVIQANLVHQQAVVQGIVTHFSINLISTYLALNAPSLSLSILHRLPPSPALVFWWNSLIRNALSLSCLHHSLSLLRNMLALGFSPDHYTFPFVLKACGEIPYSRYGASMHTLVLKNGFQSNVFVCNALVAMYDRCGALGSACQMFDEMCEDEIQDLVSWNSIVAAYVHSGDYRNGLQMFRRMCHVGGVDFRPDVISLVNVLPACAILGALFCGKQVHGFATRSGLFEDLFVGNALVDMYAKCERMHDANQVFQGMKEKDVVSWNAMVTGYSQIGNFKDALGFLEMMKEENIVLDIVSWSTVIAGYAQRGLGYETLDVFRRMQVCGSKPNEVTLVSLLSGCASVGALLHGKETHCYAIKCMLKFEGCDLEDDLLVINGLIDMYAKCRTINVARAIFDSVAVKDRNVVTWTAMIGGYAQHGEANDALELFSQMFKQDRSMKPNGFTISCSLVACARLGALRFGRQIHAYVMRHHYNTEILYVTNCLIDMYSKSGDIDAARVVFDNMKERNSVSWTSLMTGYGMHGRGEEALEVFAGMRRVGFVLDGVTFLVALYACSHSGIEALEVFAGMRRVGFVLDGVTFLVALYACSHSGMVDQGIRYFNDMSKEFGIIPQEEHYACMVDLLGRAGRFEEAMELIRGMPMKPSVIVWVSLLSGCRTHGNVELGEYAANRLLELESENDGSYTLLSNIYANARRWKDVARIRSLMRHTGVRKRPGCSWVQGKSGTATFFAGDRTHPQSDQIYEILNDLIQRIKVLGYVPQTSFALHDVDDEEKGDLLLEHSEKLALAYSILISTPGSPIRITKNLRVCGDCHTAITYISKIIDHEIILRDSSRFHHFKNGSCSCRGYW